MFFIRHFKSSRHLPSFNSIKTDWFSQFFGQSSAVSYFYLVNREQSREHTRLATLTTEYCSLNSTAHLNLPSFQLALCKFILSFVAKIVPNYGQYLKCEVVAVCIHFEMFFLIFLIFFKYYFAPAV